MCGYFIGRSMCVFTSCLIFSRPPMESRVTLKLLGLIIYCIIWRSCSVVFICLLLIRGMASLPPPMTTDDNHSLIIFSNIEDITKRAATSHVNNRRTDLCMSCPSFFLGASQKNMRRHAACRRHQAAQFFPDLINKCVWQMNRSEKSKDLVEPDSEVYNERMRRARDSILKSKQIRTS